MILDVSQMDVSAKLGQRDLQDHKDLPEGQQDPLGQLQGIKSGTKKRNQN